MAPDQRGGNLRQMKLEEIQKSALELPDSERARLAAELLESLPRVLVDHDDGITEARKRSKELDAEPSASCSWQELRDDLGR